MTQSDKQKRFKVTYIDWVTADSPEGAIRVVAENAYADNLIEKFATAEEDLEEED